MLLDGTHGVDTFLVLLVEDLLLSLLVIHFTLQLLIDLVLVALVGRALEVHLLNAGPLLGDLVLQILHFLGEFLHKVVHDRILLIQAIEDVEELFSLIFGPHVPYSHLLLDGIKGSLDLLFLGQTLLILLFDALVGLFFVLDRPLILPDLLLQLVELLLLDVLGFDEVFEADVVLYFVVELLAFLLELLFLDFGLLLEGFEVFLGLVAGIVGIVGELYRVLYILVFLVQLRF